MNASYGGFEDTLAYNATLADITGNGTYTVKVTADTDGYRNALDGKKPNGIAILGNAPNQLKKKKGSGIIE